MSMSVSEGATILAAIFNNLLGILSSSVGFFSSIFQQVENNVDTRSF